MKDAQQYLDEIRVNVGKIRRQGKVTPAENALLGMLDGLAGLQLRLMERVAALETIVGRAVSVAASAVDTADIDADTGDPDVDARAPRRPTRTSTRARRGASGDRAAKDTAEPKRTERPTGRNNRKSTDIDRGII